MYVYKRLIMGLGCHIPEASIYVKVRIRWWHSIRPPSGVITRIKKDYAYHRLNITTDFEAVTIKINIGKVITICKLYITPNEPLNIWQIRNLIVQLPEPFFLIEGDLNARSIAWGDVENNDHGVVIENLLQSSNVCVLNTGVPTHLHKQTNTLTCVDLTLTSLNIFVELEWQVEEDLYESDHFPCCDEFVTPLAIGNTSIRYNTDKADWKLFKTLSIVQFNYRDIENIDMLFNNKNIDMRKKITIEIAAQMSIPSTLGHKYTSVPWWNEACKATHKENIGLGNIKGQEMYRI